MAMSLAEKLRAEMSASKGATAKDERKFLAGAKCTKRGATADDLEYFDGSCQVVRLMLAEKVAAATVALAGGKRVTKSQQSAALALVDDERVSLRFNGQKVVATLTVTYAVADGSTGWLNFSATLTGKVADYLAGSCQRVARKGEGAPANG